MNMKTRFKSLATMFLAAFIVGGTPAFAGVPLRWSVETSRATTQRIDIYRGETVTVTADLMTYGQPLALAGEAALYVQTNGMGSAWWTVPATVVSNRIAATLAPSAYPADASLLTCYLGSPALNYRAAFAARILGAPGPAPNTVLPPVVTLDFDSIEILNAPYYTRTESDARYGGASITAAVVTNIAAAVSGAATNAVMDGLRYGLDLGTGAFLGEQGSGIGLGYAGGLYYLKGEQGGWDPAYEVARKSDLPDVSGLLARSGGTATNLTVVGTFDDAPALTVGGFFEASQGLDVGTDLGGLYFYTTSTGQKKYVGNVEISASGVPSWHNEVANKTEAFVLSGTLANYVASSGGTADNLMITGEAMFASNFEEGETGAISYKSGDFEGTYCDWYIGVAGYWGGTYRFRKPPQGVTESIAFISDIKGYTPTAGTAVVALNQSVQKVTVTGLASMAVQFPTTASDEVGDFVVFTVNTGTDKVKLGLPPGTYYAADESVVDDLDAGVTIMYFTTISQGVWAIGRQALKPITITQ